MTTEPVNANIRLLNHSSPYQPGMRLPPGSYELEITQAGYAPRHESLQITDRDATLKIALEPAKYALTVQAEPPDAQIRLLGTELTYKPGIALAPGEYQVEASKAGYATRTFPVRIAESAITVPIKLEKQAQKYRFTVQPDPPSASVKLLGSKATYKPGMELAPGNYTVQVSNPGYEPQQATVEIKDSDVSLPLQLVKVPEPAKPAQYRLTVQPDPPSASVKLLGSKATYKPGMTLKPGNYSLEVSKPGYDAQRLNVSIQNSDVTVPVTLVKQPEPELYRLTVRTEPANARVRLVNSSFTYRSGVQLPPGTYTVEASASGYKTQQTTVRISDNDASASLTLEQVAIAKPAYTPSTPEPSATTKRSGAWQIGSVQIDGSISGADRGEVQRILNRYVGQSATRASLLDSAVQVYRSTGITLSFAVHNSASNAAVLSARVSKRERSSFESSVRMVTGSQLEQAGFGVSAD